MTSTKKAFGQFVIAKRQAVGLTQRELAERLFVTESAVSKWERGVSYPDISLVVPLARELGVSEGELVNASDDQVARTVEREARFNRRWKASILWTTLIAYGIALLTCFIVDLAVPPHGLNWFWVVLTAIAVSFSLTTLPLLGLTNSGWWVLAAFLVSLIVLLSVARLLYGDGSNHVEWLPTAVASILFAAVLIFGPIVLCIVDVPEPFKRHRTVLNLIVDSICLFALIAIVMTTVGEHHLLWTRGLPIAALGLVFAWIGGLVIRYVPVNGLFRAAIIVAAAGIYDYLAFIPLVSHISDSHQSNPIDLSKWHDPYINGNVSLLSFAACLIVAIVLAIAGAIRAIRSR